MLCLLDGCRQQKDHAGKCVKYPTKIWDFLEAADKHKLDKAGFATPRGGDKGAYQNHVVRNNKVIIPYEHREGVDVNHFENGYVYRVFPDQYFSDRNMVKAEFIDGDVVVGTNAFVLYRTHDQFARFPPLAGWQPRYLMKDKKRVEERRGNGLSDHGHYVKRIAGHGRQKAINEGPPQGIFAPEYCHAESNFLSKCMLAWLTMRTIDSPYLANQGAWLDEVLTHEGILNREQFEERGLTRTGFTCCPLCLKKVKYRELHDQLAFEEEDALLNAAVQVVDATRSTIVNLFHVQPLTYSDMCHSAQNVAWGHAFCNTKLGQRHCYSVKELSDAGVKVGIIRNEQFESFAWAAESLEMLRSPLGAVWIKIASDLEVDEI